AVATHLGIGHEPGTHSGALGLAEQGAALVGGQMDTGHACRFALRHAGNRGSDRGRHAAGATTFSTLHIEARILALHRAPGGPPFAYSYRDPDHADTHLGTDCPVAEPVQHLHDLRLVRASAHTEQQALDHRSAGQLGHRPVRVSVDGASQPYRLYRTLGCAAEDNAGSDHLVRVRTLCGALPASTSEAGLSMGRSLPARRGVFYFPFLSLAIRLEVSQRPPPICCTSA